MSDVSLRVVNGTRSQQPYSTFPGRFSIYQEWIGLGCANVSSATELYEVEEGIPPQILRKQTKGNFGKSKQAIFFAKYTNFAQADHTRRRTELCVAALQADSLSTCCEWKKQGDETCWNLTGRWNLFRIKLQMTNSPCHVSATHSRCSKNPPAVPRHTTPPGAVCGLFAQNLSVLRKKLPISICQNFLWPVCERFAAECPPQLRIVLYVTIRLRNPGRFTLDKWRIGPEMSNRAVGIGCHLQLSDLRQTKTKIN